MKLVFVIVLALALYPSEELEFIEQRLHFNNSAIVLTKVDLSRALRRVDPRFLSVTIDASLASDEKFMNLLGSSKIRALARALTPAFLRFGGTRQDFMVFTPQEYNWQSKVPSEATVDQLYSFTNCSGLELIFGLNALLRTADNRWNSSNAEALMQYCASRQYKMSWELGNEPNSYEKKAGVRVDGFQLGEDFVHLRKIMTESRFYQNSGLYGPDVGQPRDHRIDILEGFLQSGSEAVDACTWHHYYVNGRDTSLEDFLDPEVLDTLALKTNEVLEKVKQASPQKRVWLGETSSAYGGGALGLSDTFVAGFMWLDKLSLGAKLGLDVIMRQVFIGSGSYHLVDDNLDPLPDYWLSVLYKRLVGQEVLSLKAFPNFKKFHKRVRLYLHCTNKKRYVPLAVFMIIKWYTIFTPFQLPSSKNGAVTLIAMNLNHKAARVSVPAYMASSTVVAFVLESDQSGEEGLYSRCQCIS
uniref:Heparanase n=1 Tax=Neogobius melanostomus TaxID=47308 RepID=A0A8C6UXE2_9GOBI